MERAIEITVKSESSGNVTFPAIATGYQRRVNRKNVKTFDVELTITKNLTQNEAYLLESILNE